MNLEIEIKAWVRNPRRTEVHLAEAGATFERDYRKEDRYFRFTERDSLGRRVLKQDVRIRIDGTKTFVTYKDKRLEKDLEINNEREFEVSDPRLMSDLFLRLGAENLIEKVKIGTAWRWNGLLIEVSEVLGLGHFIEIERVLPLPDDSSEGEQELSIRESESMINQLFARLEIPANDREIRTYTSMLSELKQMNTDQS